MGTLQKVTAGQPFSMGADTYNAFIDAAIKTKKNQTLGESNTTSDRKYNTILLSNSTGTDYDRFDVVGLGDPVITPTENLTAFQTSVTLNLVAPDEEVHTGKWAILLEPIADGRYGSAIRSGITPAVITVPTGFDHYEFVDLVVDTLTCLPTGSAKILWKESGTGAGINCVLDLSYQKESQNACANASGEAIPGYGVCKITTIDSEGRRSVVKPTADNLTEIMLAPPQGVPIGADFEGLPPFDNNAAVTGTIALGDEIGATSGAWTMTTGKTGFKSNGAVGGRARIRPFKQSVSAEIPVLLASDTRSLTTGFYISGSYPLGFMDLDNTYTVPSTGYLHALGVSFNIGPVVVVDLSATSDGPVFQVHLDLRDTDNNIYSSVFRPDATSFSGLIASASFLETSGALSVTGNTYSTVAGIADISARGIAGKTIDAIRFRFEFLSRGYTVSFGLYVAANNMRFFSTTVV